MIIIRMIICENAYIQKEEFFIMETDPQSASIFTQLLILLVLTLIRGYFAGAEMAVASVNKNKIHRLKEQGNKKAALIERLMEGSTAFLSAIQLIVTLAGFLSSAVAAKMWKFVCHNIFSPFLSIHELALSRSTACYRRRFVHE